MQRKPKTTLFVGQVNLDKYPLPAKRKMHTEFLQALNQIPLFLQKTSNKANYLFLFAVDRCVPQFIDAMWVLSEMDGLYESREEVEDEIRRGTFDFDGILHIPSTCVEVLADIGTEEFEDYSDTDKRQHEAGMEQYLRDLGKLYTKHDITSLQHLARILTDVSPDLIRRKKHTNSHGMKKENIGSDWWVSNGYTAEIVRSNHFPGWENLPEIKIMKTILSCFDSKYEQASLLPVLIRQNGHTQIAVLKSKHYTAYINAEYACMVERLIIHICGELDMVYATDQEGKVVKIVAPMRLQNETKEIADSADYQEILESVALTHGRVNCREAQRLPDGQCLGYQRGPDDDEPVEYCKGCPKHTLFETE